MVGKAKIKVYYRVTVHKDGKKIYDSGLKKSKSLVLQFLQILHDSLAYETITVKRIDGSSPSWSRDVRVCLNAPSGETEEGILVGSGTTAPTNSDYCMATQIMSGSGAGQLNYGIQAFTAPAVAAGNVDWTLTRGFLNGSGATVVVREIGAAAGPGTTTPTTATGALILRDVLASPVSVANGATCTVEYIIRTTV